MEVARIAHKNLPAGFRELVNSHKLQERSIKESAEEIGISGGTAQSGLFHAKITLRKSPTSKLMLSTFFCGMCVCQPA